MFFFLPGTRIKLIYISFDAIASSNGTFLVNNFCTNFFYRFCTARLHQRFWSLQIRKSKFGHFDSFELQKKTK